MIEKKEIGKIFKVGFTLCAITAISALVLAVVNSVTEPIIAKNLEEKQNKAMKAVIQDAEEFTPIYIGTMDFVEPVNGLYKATDSNEEEIGYIVMVSPNGYGGEINMAVGVDTDCKIIGVEVISQSETAGLGSKCTDSEFKNRFIGKTSPLSVVKSGAKEDQIDAISGATVTSKAVTKGVNTAVDAVKFVVENEKV